jgi:hypothetical protein
MYQYIYREQYKVLVIITKWSFKTLCSDKTWWAHCFFSKNKVVSNCQYFNWLVQAKYSSLTRINKHREWRRNSACGPNGGANICIMKRNWGLLHLRSHVLLHRRGHRHVRLVSRMQGSATKLPSFLAQSTGVEKVVVEDITNWITPLPVVFIGSSTARE